jgi:virginiamycin B lyase
MSTPIRLNVEQLECRDVPSGFPVQTFKLPAGTNFPGNLTVGGDGNVWFTCGLATTVGYVTPTGSAKVFDTTSVSRHGIDGLTRGPDGNLWFVEFWDNKFGKITPTGQIAQVRLRQDHGPTGITLGPDHKFWITTFDGSVGRISTHGKAKWFHPKVDGLHQIVDFHGALYVREDRIIGRLATDGVITHKFKTHFHGNLEDLAFGPDGKLWFTEHTGSGTDFVGSLGGSGHVVEHPVDVGNSGLGQLTGAADGNLYVREGDYMLGVHTDGTVFAKQYLGFIAGDGSVVEGSDGNAWYAEGVLGRIGVAHVNG